MSKRRLPILNIDFSKTPADNITKLYPLSDASMSNALGEKWGADDIRRVNSQHGLYTDIPQRCRGRCKDINLITINQCCPWSESCPIDFDIVDNNFKGKNCPVEVLESFKLFAGYVLDLEISPDDFVDLQTVVDLVRLHIQMRRCDLYLRELPNPVYEEKHGSVVQKTGEVKKDKVEPVGFAAQQKLRDQISKKYEQLLASRKARADQQAREGKAKQDAASWFSSLVSAGKTLEGIKDIEEDIPELTDGNDVVDAEFNTDSIDSED